MKKRFCIGVRFILALCLVGLVSCYNETEIINEGYKYPDIPIPIVEDSVLSADALVIDEMPLTLESNDGTVLIYSYTESSPDIQPGDVLISAEEEGYLRKVVSVLDTGGSIEVTTEQASLEEAFEELHVHAIIHMESNISFLKSHGAYTVEMGGADVIKSAYITGQVDPNYGYVSVNFPYIPTYPLQIMGGYLYQPTLEIEIDINNQRLKTFKAVLSQTVIANVTADYSAYPEPLTFEIPETTLIGEGGLILQDPLILFSEEISLPGVKVPLVIVGEFSFGMGGVLTMPADTNTNFGVDIAFQASTGLYYDKRVWQTVNSFDCDCNPHLTTDNPIEQVGTAFITPTVEIYILDALGPYIDLNTYGHGEIVLNPDPTLEIGIGMQGYAGADMQILSTMEPNVYFELFDMYDPVFTELLP